MGERRLIKPDHFLMAALFLLSSVIIPGKSFAQLQTARIFINGMVLQRDADIPVWGVANPEDTVIVTVSESSDTTFADESGNWMAVLDPLPAGGPYQMIISNGDQTLTRSNVYIGDVFLAIGQSNMEMTLSQADGGAAEAASANNETIRQFKIPKAIATEPASDIPSGSSWTPATSSYAGNFTALGYYFARDLQAEIGVPVGLINASYGGARIEAYMSDEMLGFDETWITLANGENERQPTLIYNAMIHPILQVPLKGMLWYQGESNADNMEDALAYGDLFQRMINAYRDLWNMPELPFCWVQLPGYGTPADENSPAAWDAWPQLRACQSRALALPFTGEVTTIDVGDVDIHPTNKEPVGHRMSLVVRKVVYGEDIVYSGPRYKTHDLLENGRIKVKFDYVGDSLISTSVNDTIHWFALGDGQGNLYPATAILDGDSVLVWNDAVPDPAILRYAWEYNPQNVNLYNADSLPAAPFLVDVVYPGFEISEFITTSTLLERGSSAILTWKVHGATQISLNGVTVDSIGGMEVWPIDTMSYTLKATDRLNPDQRDSATIIIDVIDPLPTIFISTDQGDLIEPGTEITINADANAPGGGTVTQVEFFIDGTSIGVDTEAPYTINWTPPEDGDYTITGRVTNSDGVSVDSDPLVITVTYLVLTIYEAEDASFTGGGTIRSSSNASGGQYLDLTDAWVLTFAGVHADTTGIYQMHIRYLLNYESPKAQNLFINGDFIQEITFTAPNTSTWLTYKISVELVEGDNEVEFQGVWNWMSFDYIALALPGEPPEDTVEVVNTERVSDQFDLSVLPNPFTSSTFIRYSIPEPGNVTLDIIDLNGRKVAGLSEEYCLAGENNFLFSPEGFGEGVYLLRLTYNDSVTLFRKITLIR